MPWTMASGTSSVPVSTSFVLLVSQTFWYLKDLTVPNEPESPLLVTSGHLSVLKSAESLTAHVSVRPTSSLTSTIHEAGLPPLIQYVKEHSDSDSELPVEGSLLYSRRHYSLMQMQQSKISDPCLQIFGMTTVGYLPPPCLLVPLTGLTEWHTV